MRQESSSGLPGPEIVVELNQFCTFVLSSLELDGIYILAGLRLSIDATPGSITVGIDIGIVGDFPL